MWVALACGIALLIAGFFAYFGTTPRNNFAIVWEYDASVLKAT
jgi:hypothetical protein